jgi:hypothetical protein
LYQVDPQRKEGGSCTLKADQNHNYNKMNAAHITHFHYHNYEFLYIRWTVAQAGGGGS